MSKNNTTTSEQIRAGMLAAYAAFRSAFPAADKVNFTAQVYDGRLQVYGSILMDYGWTTGISLEGAETVDEAIASVRSKLSDPEKIRAEAAALLRRAEKIEGGAK
jgi:hypothetical protein